MPRFVTLDLAELRSDLAEHYQNILRDTYEGTCPVCSEAVSQEVCECEICGTPVVWLHSPLWKQLWGSPADMSRRLSAIEPEDNAGKELCRLAGLPGFANQSEANRWGKAARKLGQPRMLGIARHVTKNKRGRGALAHGLNLAEKIAREEKISKPKQRPDFSGEEKKLLF